MMYNKTVFSENNDKEQCYRLSILIKFNVIIFFYNIYKEFLSVIVTSNRIHIISYSPLNKLHGLNLYWLMICQQQQKWLHSDLDDEECFGNEHENPQQSWNWLDKWMASQHVVRQEDSSYVSLSITDDISEKTFELGPEDVNLAHQTEKSPYSSTQSNKDSVPSYMAPTKSAKAKIRSPGPIKPKSPPGVAQWNSTPKKVTARRWSYDSSARSPNPKISAKWMATHSPQTRVHDRTSLVGPPAHRYNYNQNFFFCSK